MKFIGNPHDLDLDVIRNRLEEFIQSAAPRSTPGIATQSRFDICNGKLELWLTLPTDTDGTAGAPATGQQAADILAIAQNKLIGAWQVLDEFLPPPLTSMVLDYLTVLGEATGTLAVVPEEVLNAMPRGDVSGVGDRIYLPLPSGDKGGVQAIYLGISTFDTQAALVVALEAPPPLSAGFDPRAMLPHPNGLGLIYCHPGTDDFWRDPAQPPRTHLRSLPQLEDLQARINGTILVAPDDVEAGLPVKLLSVTPAEESAAGNQWVTLRLQSSFDPHKGPLDMWTQTCMVGAVSDHKESADGKHVWTVTTDLTQEQLDMCRVSLDPLDRLEPGPAFKPQAGPWPPESKAPGDNKAGLGNRVDAHRFASLPEDTPVHVNGVPGTFQGVAPAYEAPDAVWVTIDRGIDTSGIGSIRSVAVPGTNLLSHVISYTQCSITLD
jgi:hypothetical protein